MAGKEKNGDCRLLGARVRAYFGSRGRETEEQLVEVLHLYYGPHPSATAEKARRKQITNHPHGESGCTMAQITQDGFTFDSDWIDARIAEFLDQKAPWVSRRIKLNREIADHEAAMSEMPTTMPLDLPAQAHAKVYLAALRKTLENLDAEMLRRT